MLTTLAARSPSPLSTMDLWRLGGTLDRMPVKAGAYSMYLLGFEANWDEPDLETCARNIAWIRGCLEAFAPCFRGGTYLNFPGIEEDVLAQAPSEPHLQRLKAVREQCDSDYLFRRQEDKAIRAASRSQRTGRWQRHCLETWP
ncbi:hypothetical protein E7T09_11530 [Deinococcus sp. KSM4-11]|uniref:hypothetical protein n=1 Tax=Deinococcus sp. KSM4-11 TaxID=2568654 RepID=UPI0010A36212|nr:hypothetical protein [Deinococcus sp. KSM4-11]THF86713.1 hypothetical protein E7T09_11530 [Deinococcus sp. KSM4-11]